MREIKFRLWNPQEKKMFYDVQDCFHDMYGDGVFGEHGFNELLEDAKEGRCVLMQYTGLKDKNGKEIWEGDIVEGIRGVKGECKFKKGRFLVEYEDEMELTFIYENKTDIKVLGNIYENPELLTS